MIRRIIIANNHEYYFSAPELLPSRRWFDYYRDDEFSKAERALFWGGDDKLVVLPQPSSIAYLSMVREAMGYKNLHVFVPRTPGDSLCDDLIGRAEEWDAFRHCLGGARDVELFAYGVTPQLYRLINRLRASGLAVHAPQLPPEEACPAVHRLGSKSGFRELAERLAKTHPEIRMPRGVVCRTESQVVQACAALEPAAAVMLKSDDGAGGVGMVKLAAPFTPERSAAALAECLRLNYTARRFPIVVEEYIAAVDSPTAEAVVLPDGQVRPLLYGRQVLVNQKTYVGFELGPDLFPPAALQAMERVLVAVGGELARAGYKGWFDADFVRGADGCLYILEINIRRTGVSHVWEVLEKLGPARPAYVIDGHLPVHSPAVDWDVIAARLGVPRQRDAGALMTNGHLIPGSPRQVGYMAWSPTVDGLARQVARVQRAITP